VKVLTVSERHVRNSSTRWCPATVVAAGAPLGYVTDYSAAGSRSFTAPEAGLVLYINAVPSW